MIIPHVLLETTELVLLLVGILLAAAAIGVLLYFTVFSHVRQKKAVRELSRRFEYLHSLLFGQDSQYLKRIEMIATTNLLYVNAHTNFSKRFKEVRDRYDTMSQTAVNNLKDLVDEHDYKALKAALPVAKETIDVYDEQVNSLDRDLIALVRPEEECRQQSLLLKENLRKIKQDYYVHQADLTLVSNSFDRVFSLLDDKFGEFENFVESAQYEDAKALLPNIGGVITELGKAMKELPNLCIAIQSVVPDKISSLQNRYEEMTRADFPLHHLMVNTGVDEIQRQMEHITKRVQNFDLAHVQDEIDAILARIDDFTSSFEKEKNARIVFETECDQIYADSSLIDKKYIRLCNALPDIKHIYILPADEQSVIDRIKNWINKAGATKRSLDTFIHCGTKQPFSLLVEKMHALRDETEQASLAIDEFDRFLLSLREDSESAFESVRSYYQSLHNAEYQIREIGLDAVKNKYQADIDRLYGVVDTIHTALRALPIDVEKVRELVSVLREDGNKLIAAVNGDFEKFFTAGSSILFANRDRMNLGEVDVILKQAEAYYFNGDFQLAYDTAIGSIRRLRGEE